MAHLKPVSRREEKPATALAQAAKAKTSTAKKLNAVVTAATLAGALALQGCVAYPYPGIYPGYYPGFYPMAPVVMPMWGGWWGGWGGWGGWRGGWDGGFRR